MSSKTGNNGGGVSPSIRTALACVVAYLLGVALSPLVVPVDYFLRNLVANPPPPRADDANDTAVVVPRRPDHPRVDSSSSSSSSSIPDEPPTTAVPPLPPAGGRSRLDQSHASLLDRDSRDDGGVDPFSDVDIVVHRNGEPDPCSRQRGGAPGTTTTTTSRALLDSASAVPESTETETTTTARSGDSKHAFDAMLTLALTGNVASSSSSSSSSSSFPALLHDRGEGCGPTWTDPRAHDDAGGGAGLPSMLRYCDMGANRTTVQSDHELIVNVPGAGTRPCHFHTREGVRITGLGQLARLAREAGIPTTTTTSGGECAGGELPGDGGTCDATLTRRRELHLYAVPAGRVFMFAPRHVGEIFELKHVSVPLDLPVWLEVISLSPRVFDVFNFFDREESAAIVVRALAETSETHRMKRSSTGASGYNVNSKRTSENGFDTHGKVAQAVKRRCMTVLGFDEYEESLTDGLQVLRYNKTTAYIPHLDWIDDHQKQNEHDFDSEHLGTNRFATILLYMTDLSEGDGGETVFTEGWPVGVDEKDRIDFNDAKTALRESGDVAGILKEDSWEEQMVVRCRSRLSIRPHSSRAVLFYSQNPDGTPDQKSMHGGCPVISGEKWAANLWVWNGPRGGFEGSPKNQHVVERNRAAGVSQDNNQKKASFANTQTDEAMRNAQLYFQDTFWGKMGYGDPTLNVNTYKGHQWNVKVDEKTVKTFVIDDRPQQTYTI